MFFSSFLVATIVILHRTVVTILICRRDLLNIVRGECLDNFAANFPFPLLCLHPLFGAMIFFLGVDGQGVVDLGSEIDREFILCAVSPLPALHAFVDPVCFFTSAVAPPLV